MDWTGSLSRSTFQSGHETDESARTAVAVLWNKRTRQAAVKLLD